MPPSASPRPPSTPDAPHTRQLVDASRMMAERHMSVCAYPRPEDDGDLRAVIQCAFLHGAAFMAGCAGLPEELWINAAADVLRQRAKSHLQPALVLPPGFKLQ